MSTPAVLGDVKHSDPSRSFVSKTARSVAGMRAKETEKGDAALVVDPFAKLLAGPEDGSWLDTLPESSREFLVDMLAVRTKHIDDFLTRQAGAGTAQLVIVGSGLDTRSYRLAPLTGFPVYELDFPEVHAFKTGKLSGVSTPLAALSSVGVDLSQPSWPSALISAGFDTAKPSIWLLEGLIGYLTESEARLLLSTMKGLSAPGTVALVTFVGTKREIAPGAGPSPLHSFHCDTGDSFMEENGWLEAKMRPMGDIAAEYGRTRIPRDYNYFVVTAHV